MKKLLLSIFVIGAFFVYGLHEKDEAAHVPAVIPPQPSANSTSVATPTPTTSGTTPVTVTPSPVVVAQQQYRDGSYTGSVADAFYGNIQVRAIITNGQISDVQFLQYPNDRGTSVMINTQAMPYLKQEAIQAQNANVAIISGATDSSIAFRQSLAAALVQAH